jgi:hypothetical protein
MKIFIIFLGITLGLFFYSFNRQPDVDNSPVYVEQDGVLAVEAEHFYQQSKFDIRSWFAIDEGFNIEMADPDDRHVDGASGGKYVECLPDTRTTHDDKLTAGENFSNKAGEMAILHYKVYINNPGKYYVWVRAFSTGTEDNGIHVGIDGEWPASGQRLQWCEGKNEWTWESKQRTQDVHCGEPKLIHLEIDKPGEHEIQFSMREDGFEFDKFVLTKAYESPVGNGPEELVKQH